ncbi:hypothetical protein [Algivirga pacifica]|uniref:Uncharacterized protein n=1 Tax=Algivirga pacifica TaxID=1162670 RepID=A0ABP9DHE2_9BACT
MTLIENKSTTKDRAVFEFNRITEELRSLIVVREEEERAEAVINKIKEVKSSLATNEKVGNTYSSSQLKQMLDDINACFSENIKTK